MKLLNGRELSFSSEENDQNAEKIKNAVTDGTVSKIFIGSYQLMDRTKWDAELVSQVGEYAREEYVRTSVRGFASLDARVVTPGYPMIVVLLSNGELIMYMSRPFRGNAMQILLVQLSDFQKRNPEVYIENKYTQLPLQLLLFMVFLSALIVYMLYLAVTGQ